MTDQIDQLDADIRWSGIRLALESCGQAPPIRNPKHLREWLGRYAWIQVNAGHIHKHSRVYVVSHWDGKLKVHLPAQRNHDVPVMGGKLNVRVDSHDEVSVDPKDLILC